MAFDIKNEILKTFLTKQNLILAFIIILQI